MAPERHISTILDEENNYARVEAIPIIDIRDFVNGHPAPVIEEGQGGYHIMVELTDAERALEGVALVQALREKARTTLNSNGMIELVSDEPVMPKPVHVAVSPEQVTIGSRVRYKGLLLSSDGDKENQ